MEEKLENYTERYNCDKIGLDVNEAARHTGMSRWEIESELEKEGWDRPLFPENKWQKY